MNEQSSAGQAKDKRYKNIFFSGGLAGLDDVSWTPV